MPIVRERTSASVGTVYVAIVSILAALLAVSNFLERKLSIFSILSYRQGELENIYKIVSVATILFAIIFYVFIIRNNNVKYGLRLIRYLMIGALITLIISLSYLLYIDNNYIIRYEFNGIVSDIFRPHAIRDPFFGEYSFVEQNVSMAKTLEEGMGPAERLRMELLSDGWVMYTSYLIAAALMAFSLNISLIVLAYLAAVGTGALREQRSAEEVVPEPETLLARAVR